MEKKILILSDFVSFGNVALGSARSILTRMGCTVFALPTAVISNTWNYGNCTVLDTTDYIRDSLRTWNQLGFSFDAVFIGYIANRQQAQWIAAMCPQWHAEGATIFLDPILADNGKLYNGVTPEQISFMRELMGCADYVLPNSTEAQYLAGMTPPQWGLPRRQMEQLIRSLSELCPGNIIVTGTCVDGQDSVAVWDRNGLEILPYNAVPGDFSGAGDAFSALFIGGCLSGAAPAQSAREAIDRTKEWILRSQSDTWLGTGLPVERYL